MSKVQLLKTFLFQAIQFIQTGLIQPIQFSISIDFVYTELISKLFLKSERKRRFYVRLRDT